MSAFWDVIMVCDLIDLGFSSLSFTWSNLRKGLANVQERLDRVLCNHGWLNGFSKACVVHLSRTRSDHCPVMVHDGTRDCRQQLMKPFRLQVAWFLHPKFEAFLEQCWAAG